MLQNKCIRFCLNLNDGAHIGETEFEKIDWLSVNNCFERFISSMSFKLCNNTNLVCMKVFQLFKYSNVMTSSNTIA